MVVPLSYRLAAAAMILAAASIELRAGPKLENWASVKNERHGFAIAYPVDVFEQKTEPATDEGRVLVSKDGKAKLLVGAFDNEDGSSLADYRQFLLDGQWAGALLDYAPVKQKWFVLSGTRNGEMFYERVSFTCGGKLINSWVMTYPVADRKLYDRVLEAIAKSYLPGAGRTGNCE